jgi:membrane associated rhomboid family serine protease
VLIAANLIVYAFTSDGFQIHANALDKLALKGSNFSFGTLMSSMFLHANLLHLLGNLWFLYLLGFAVEGRLRWWKYLIVYLGSGICGSLLHQLMVGSSHPDLPSLGASGAIMGVLGAALYMFPFAQVDFFCVGWLWTGFDGYFKVRPFATWVVCLLYPGVDLVITLFAGSHNVDGVAHFAHLGGVAGGFLLCAMFMPKRDSRTASDAKAIFAETKDLSLASNIELSEIQRSNPDDPHVVLTWMYRCIRENRIDPKCKEAFFRLLPRMLEEQPPGSVGSCLLSLNEPGAPATIPVRTLIQVASACERAKEAGVALKLYEMAWQCHDISPSEQEMALFRVAMLCERSFQNFPRAIATYQEVVNRFGMSPMADQARIRIRALTGGAVKS